MATEYFLVINGIAGDYVDPSKLLTGAFQVSSFNLPTLSTASVQPGAGGAGKTVFDPLQLTLTTESLAGLLAASASGTTIKNASLVGVTTTTTGKSAITYSLNLGNVVISDVDDPNSAQGIDLTLDYGQIGLVTRMQNTSGQLVETGSFGWNVTQNTTAGPGISLTSAGSPSVAPTVPTTYYLLIDGMDGGSVSKGHTGWFQVQDFSIDLSNSTNPQQLGGGSGKDIFNDLNLSTGSDTGLVSLLEQEASGKLLTGVRLEGVNASGQAVYDLNLGDVFVDEVQDFAGAGFDVSFNYKQVSLVTKGKDASGTLVQTGSFGWDTVTGTKVDPSTMPTLSVGPDHGAVAPSAYFLVINGIAGDYADTTKLLSGAFKVNSFTLPTLSDASGKTSFDPLRLGLTTESLAGLMSAAASGASIKDASLVGVTTINGKSAITYSLNLGDVIVSDVSDSNADQGTALSLDYGQIGLVTKGVSPSGSLQTAQSFGWDVAKNESAGPGTSLTNAGTTLAPTTPTSYFLLIDGVNGGALDKLHAGWFKLSEFSIDLSNATDPQQPGGATSSKPVFSDLSVATGSESSLTALLALEAPGTLLKGVRIEGVNGSGKAVYDLNLSDVFITYIGDSSTAGFGISFDYRDVSLVTHGQNSSGQLVQTGSFGWDTATNAKIDPASMPSISPGADHGAVAPTEYFLVVNGIAGDTIDASKLLKGAFKVSSFNLPTANNGLVSGGGADAGHPSFGSLDLTLNGDSLTGLLTDAASGTTIKDVSLVGIGTANGKSAITYSLNLGDVTVSQIEAGSSDWFNVALDYGQIGLVTKGVAPNGSLETSQSFGWDVAKNVSTGPGTSLTNSGAAVSPTAPTSFYLLVDGVNGGSTNKSHVDWFTVGGFGFSASTSPEQGGGSGNSVFGDLSVTTSSETGLAALLDREATGEHLKGIRIEGVDAQGHAVYDLNLADVVIQQVADTNLPGFAITFDYRDISVVTKGQASSGQVTQTGSFGWDTLTNTKFDPADMPSISPCYCPGTLILTERGEVPVEDLAIGDTVMTMSGAARPIRWIGRRGYLGRFAQGRKDILPVCIKAGAIEDNVPRRDLWISPHHAMYLDGVLIEAIDLVNGVTIIQADGVERIEYFHIELETHDVIIAEGSLSESFIDDDSRGMFHNVHEYVSLYPDAASDPACYCAPRCREGYQVEAVRRHLALRAGLRTAVENSGDLRGYIDEVSFDRIAGWAQNIDHPEAPVCLDIYLGGTLIGQTLANRYRADLEEGGLGSGHHAFEFVLPDGLDVSADKIEVRRSLDHAALASSQADIRAAAA